MDTQKLLVRQFYEEHCDNFFEAMWDQKCKSFSPSFERVASVILGQLSPLEVEIEKYNQYVPQSVSDAFARHLWYSQWNFADLFLIKVSINEQSFFFIFHLGICDDAWDNSNTQVIEIFNEQGEFIDATNSNCSIASMKWNDKPFAREYFRNGKTGDPPPPWIGDDPHALYHGEPLWTEKILIEKGAHIEEKGTIIRYVWYW